jgi:Na+-driven multidrug efflux pump
MGIVWEVFESFTEGLGDAASVQVSMYMRDGQPSIAKQVSHRIVFLALVLSLVATSIFLIVGPNLAVALTVDLAIENLLNDLVGMTGLANITMSITQICWSILGAQGRFGPASITILLCRWIIAMPLSLLFIYLFNFDSRSLAGAIGVGYASASGFLTFCVVESDWEGISRNAREANAMDINGLLESSEDSENDEEESSEDSSTGIGM